MDTTSTPQRPLRMPARRRTWPAWVLVPLLAACGCGYHFSDSTWARKDDVHSISVGSIANNTREFGLEKSLAFALQREIIRHGAVDLADEPGGGDAVLSGTIREFIIQPVAFDAQDEALQYETAIVVDFYLKRNSDGHILWEASGLRSSEEYSSIARVVVTSSSQFQQQNLNAGDLPALTDVQLAESSKRQALDRLLDDVVRDAYALMAEDF